MMHFLTWCDIVTSSAHTKENNNYFFKDSPFDVWKPRDSCICKTIKTSHFKPAKQNLRYQMNQERRKLMEARGVRAVQHNAICRCKQAWPKEKMLSLLCEVYWPQRESWDGCSTYQPCPCDLIHNWMSATLFVNFQRWVSDALRPFGLDSSLIIGSWYQWQMKGNQVTIQCVRRSQLRGLIQLSFCLIKSQTKTSLSSV